MEIEFTVRPEDLMASREIYARNSEVMQKSSRTETYGTASTIIAFFTLLTFLLNTYIPFILGAIITLVWVFIWPLMQKNSYHRRQIALYAESKNAASLGIKIMEFEDDILTERSELHWSKTKLPAIERIDITKTHTFLFHGTFLAFVIPKATVKKGDYEAFISAISKRYQSIQEKAVAEKVSANDT
jgi:hypothetical protein